MGKTGHWIYDGSYALGTSEVRSMYRCSECELLVEKQPSTCPYCGATMSTEEEHKNMYMLNDTKGIRHQATELIEQAYHKGYKAGVEDGRKLYEESGIFKPRNSAAEIVYCKDCVFRDDYCKCTRIGLIHMIEKVTLSGGSVFRLNDPIALCDSIRVNNDDSCSFGKRRTMAYA